ncbi:recombinase family protein [Clostridium sp. chh4-2]|uniref:recombinase family protein n=1 Tax=Clostridium sp. chh4-2 TaxID=2067550 RepID=UPI0015E1A81E|nr:recombinase family protein [Clostridium sp. chh4-2]
MKKRIESIMRVASYRRVSSDEQAKHGDSLRDQEERTLEYINNHDNMVLAGIFTDDGISGQKLERDDFQRLMDAVKSDEIDLIIFTKLDRWFRSLRHYLNTQAILEEHNVCWTAIDQPYFDTSTPHGRAFVAQSMMWAELEAQNDGIRIVDVFKNKVKYGEVISGKVPRGYRIENKHLILSEEAPAIYDSILYFLKTQSLNGTIKYMRSQHGITMTLANFKDSILRNTKYTGKFRDNDSFCPRLISDEEWNEIQKILDSNLNIKSSQRYPYIFSGLLVCDECGYKLTGCKINVYTKRKSGKEYRYQYPGYECKRFQAYKECCNGGEIREQKIEDYLLTHIREELQSYIAEYSNQNKNRIDNRARKNAIRKKLDRLKELYVDELISLDEYKVDRAKYLEELESLPDIIESPVDFTKITELLNSDFETVYATFDNEEKRRFWRTIIKEIRITKSTNRQRTFKIFF